MVFLLQQMEIQQVVCGLKKICALQNQQLNFCENYGLKEDNKPTFSFNSNEIKFESAKTLKELGISPMSVIQVKTEKPFNMPINACNNPGNMPNFQMNNQFMMGNFGMNP